MPEPTVTPLFVPVLAVHGGAGTVRRDRLSPELEREIREGLEGALSAGHAVLLRGGSACAAVTEAVARLEDCPLFNAGCGSVLTRDQTVEMDASIMEGNALRAGAVTLVQGVRNPIRLARAVLDEATHAMLGGEGAEAFARERGLVFEPPSYFVTERRLEQWRAGSSSVPSLGTVGAVALDAAGDLAAATSTGGTVHKRAGRIGDSPVIGAGTYADNRAAAVSATGNGEWFLRVVAAHDICARVRYQGLTLQQAADAVVRGELAARGGRGGVIAVDRTGQIVFSLNCEGMYRGSIDGVGRRWTGIFADEAPPR